MARGNFVGWFEIYVDDFDRATKFYEGVFDTKLEDMTDPTSSSLMRSFPGDMNGYGTPGAIVKMDGCKPGVGGTTVYFIVEDCSVELSRVEEFGGEVVMPKTSIGEHGFMCLCKDTEGNIIGIHSMV